jgi:dephospho-CoA kinase
VIKLALTGSIGMGKSTVAKMFEAAGVPVFDADAEVRSLQADGTPMLVQIEALFPGSVTASRLDRDKLAAAVLGRPEQLARLEALIHPAVRDARERFIAAHCDAAALLFDIPLLFETNGEAEFDKVIVVSAPADVQRERVLGRTGMSAAKLDAIAARQTADADKRERADFVINTGCDLSTTEAQVRDILACLGIAKGG